MKEKVGRKIVESFTYFVYITVLCVIIFNLLVFQFGLIWRSFHKILLHLQKTLLTRHGLPSYVIDDRITSSTAQVVFTESKLIGIPICVKVWQRQRVKGDMARQIQYLLEGFIYNRRWAPGVYLGIAYLERLSQDAQVFRRGPITPIPRKRMLEQGEYAFVMKALEKEWRLDHCLRSGKETLATTDGMRFLAKEVARFHKKAKPSHGKRGLPDSIARKLEFNIKRLGQALQKSSEDGIEGSDYQWISHLMKRAVTGLVREFEQRYEQGHIKRCHGDLKLTNLWIRPASTTITQPRLLALDCIDFNPDFCHIDTLSDVAMLIMDFQMLLSNGPYSNECEKLVEVFMSTYLQEMKETREEVASLLQFYITEKAIVCTYVNILLDNDLEYGRKYLALAQQHGQRLLKALPSLEGSTDRVEVGIAATTELVDIH
jgi:aminoglycoside phosphotransferase family enzyme